MEMKMKPRKAAYTPINPFWFHKLIKWSLGAWLTRVYRVESRGEGLFKRLRPPYVIVSNHLTTRDPFWLSVFVPAPIYWVASDGNMRTRLMRGLLRMVGTIPKAKSIPDIETVNHIVRVVRKGRGVVGLFPEGQQSWDGRTLPLFPATAKLLKLLKVPVVAAVIEGGYFALPRWTWTRRKGSVRIAWKLLFGAEELKALSAEEIFERLSAGIAHDEQAWMESAKRPFRSARRAERLELSLFACPRCGALGGLRSSGNLLRCSACGAGQLLDRYGRFRPLDGGEAPPFPSIPAWEDWQRGEIGRRALLALGGSEPLFSDPGTRLFRGWKMNPLAALGRGELLLYPDRLEFRRKRGSALVFKLEELEGVGVLRRNLFEFYRGRDLFQARFATRSISARKWLEAIEAFKAARAMCERA